MIEIQPSLIYIVLWRRTVCNLLQYLLAFVGSQTNDISVAKKKILLQTLLLMNIFEYCLSLNATNLNTPVDIMTVTFMCQMEPSISAV